MFAQPSRSAALRRIASTLILTAVVVAGAAPSRAAEAPSTEDPAQIATLRRLLALQYPNLFGADRPASPSAGREESPIVESSAQPASTSTQVQN